VKLKLLAWRAGRGVSSPIHMEEVIGLVS